MKNIYSFLILLSLLISISELKSQNLHFQGKLIMNGTPVTGVDTFNFSIPTIGWSSTPYIVSVENGLYSLELAVPDTLFYSQSMREMVVYVGNPMMPIDTVKIYAPLRTEARPIKKLEKFYNHVVNGTAPVFFDDGFIRFQVVGSYLQAQIISVSNVEVFGVFNIFGQISGCVSGTRRLFNPTPNTWFTLINPDPVCVYGDLALTSSISIQTNQPSNPCYLITIFGNPSSPGILVQAYY